MLAGSLAVPGGGSGPGGDADGVFLGVHGGRERDVDSRPGNALAAEPPPLARLIAEVWALRVWALGAAVEAPHNDALGLPMDIRALLCRADRPWPCAEAVAVVGCESGGDPSARNGDHWGLFQIAYRWHRDKLLPVAGSDRPEELLRPEVNIDVAEIIYRDRRWSAWACQPTTSEEQLEAA